MAENENPEAASSEPLAIPMRSRSWSQIVQANALIAFRARARRARGLSRTRNFCFGSHSLSLYRRHFDQVTHVLDLSAQCG